MADVTKLYRPVGSKELALIQASGDRAFPPRLPLQPIFYPVLNEAYAIQIARDWNALIDGGGKEKQSKGPLLASLPMPSRMLYSVAEALHTGCREAIMRERNNEQWRQISRGLIPLPI